MKKEVGAYEWHLLITVLKRIFSTLEGVVLCHELIVMLAKCIWIPTENIKRRLQAGVRKAEFHRTRWYRYPNDLDRLLYGREEGIAADGRLFGDQGEVSGVLCREIQRLRVEDIEEFIGGGVFGFRFTLDMGWDIDVRLVHELPYNRMFIYAVAFLNVQPWVDDLISRPMLFYIEPLKPETEWRSD